MTMELSDQYPFKAPKCQFITKIFHPCVYSNGFICRNNEIFLAWSPGTFLTQRNLLISMQSNSRHAHTP